MASNNCCIQRISILDDVIPFYVTQLNVIEEHLQTLNENETSDQTGWFTQSVNFDKIKWSLNKLKEEVKSGKKLYNGIFVLSDYISSKQSDFDNTLKSKETQEYDNLQSKIYLENLINLFHSDQDKLSKTFSELQSKINQQETQPTTVVAKGAVNNVNEPRYSQYIPSVICNGWNMFFASKEVQTLPVQVYSDTLQQNKVLAKFQIHHYALSQIIEGMQMHKKDLDTFLQNHHITKDVNIISDTDVVTKATRIYFLTENEEITELKSTEPDMSEEERSGLAARAAVRSCKTFLKKLDYSDSQADEFIKGLL